MTKFTDDEIMNLLEGIKRDEETIDRYRAALEQAEMDMGVIWMYLPPKERETLRIARDRILMVLGQLNVVTG